MQKRLRIFYDNLERRIVVIIHLLKQEGILCTNALYGYCTWLYKAQNSDGSSPVTTQVCFYLPIFLHHLLLSDVGFILMLNVLVCEDRHVFIMYINQ